MATPLRPLVLCDLCVPLAGAGIDDAAGGPTLAARILRAMTKKLWKRAENHDLRINHKGTAEASPDQPAAPDADEPL